MRIVLLFLVLCSLSLSALAQKKFEFGVKGGLSIVNLRTDNSISEYSSRTSYHFGGFGVLMLNDKMYLQSEILFSSQGARSRIDTSQFNRIVDAVELEKDVITRNYINVPLLFKYSIVKDLNALLGTQISFLTFSEIENTSGFLIENEEGEFFEPEVVNQDWVKSVDFGLVFGVDYCFSFGLLFDLRYNFGLVDNVDESFFFEKNSVFHLSLGYKF